eukprot:754416-Hanusia_phi.AAC.1
MMPVTGYEPPGSFSERFRSSHAAASTRLRYFTSLHELSRVNSVRTDSKITESTEEIKYEIIRPYYLSTLTVTNSLLIQGEIQDGLPGVVHVPTRLAN